MDKSKTFAFYYTVPKDSLFGPFMFIACIEDLLSMIEEHSVDPYLYADDGQLNDHVLMSNVGAAILFMLSIHYLCSASTVWMLCTMVCIQTSSTKSI